MIKSIADTATHTGHIVLIANNNNSHYNIDIGHNNDTHADKLIHILHAIVHTHYAGHCHWLAIGHWIIFWPLRFHSWCQRPLPCWYITPYWLAAFNSCRHFTLPLALAAIDTYWYIIGIVLLRYAIIISHYWLIFYYADINIAIGHYYATAIRHAGWPLAIAGFRLLIAIIIIVCLIHYIDWYYTLIIFWPLHISRQYWYYTLRRLRHWLLIKADTIPSQLCFHASYWYTLAGHTLAWYCIGYHTARVIITRLTHTLYYTHASWLPLILPPLATCFLRYYAYADFRLHITPLSHWSLVITLIRR